jgi:hypothetical protein
VDGELLNQVSKVIVDQQCNKINNRHPIAVLKVSPVLICGHMMN